MQIKKYKIKDYKLAYTKLSDKPIIIKHFITRKIKDSFFEVEGFILRDGQSTDSHEVINNILYLKPHITTYKGDIIAISDVKEFKNNYLNYHIDYVNL